MVMDSAVNRALRGAVQVAPDTEEYKVQLREPPPNSGGLTELGRELAQMEARNYFTSVPWVGPGGSFCSPCGLKDVI